MKEEVENIKKEVEELENESIAMELVKDYKKQNKRLFIIWLVTFICLIALVGYVIYLQSDIGTIDETEVTQSNNKGNNNFIRDGGVINNGNTKDKNN